MFGFAISILGLVWFSAAALIGSTLGDVWTFGIVLCLAHMVCGFIITLCGLARID